MSIREDVLAMIGVVSDRMFTPLVGHWNENTFVLRDGSIGAVYHLPGIAAELMDSSTISGLHYALNQLVRSIAHPRLEWWDHFIRQDGQAMQVLPAVNNWFGTRFDDAYRATQGDGQLFREDQLVSIIMHPARERAEILAQDFEAVMFQVEAALFRYGCRRLGTREHNGVVFSEIAEAWHLLANGWPRPLGLVDGRLGRLVVPERVVFGHQDYQIMREGDSVFGAILSFREYPQQTRPVMFAELAHVPFPITVTNAMAFRGKAESIKAMDDQENQMRSSRDAAESQIEDLRSTKDDVASGRSVFVTHDFSVAIRGPTIDELDRRVARTQSILSDAGVTAIRETTAIKPAFYGQIPGNRRWWPRSAPIKSINATAMAPHHGVPRGHYRGRWGAPIVMLRTTADTEYAFHFHVQDSASIPAEDLGNCLLIGPAGSGKTALMGSVCLFALRRSDARVVIVDKDMGLSVLVAAAGGSYLILQSGSPSGLAPLRGLTDSDDDTAFLERFVRGLILADGQGELSPEEDRRLGRAVARQMQMPPSMRALGGIAVMLGQRTADGAAARLRKWCRGERLGWAFDNEQDDLRMDAHMIGFDTTALLRDDLVCSPTLSYLFYRVRKLIDGKPLVLAVDEFWRTDRVEAFRDENNDHLKTIRKNEGVVLLATQSARDALDSPNSHTFKQQVPTKIFFGDESASREDLVDGMGLTEAEFLAVTRQLPNMRHTFLMKRPGGSVLCRFDMSGARDKIAVVSARRATHDLMNRLIARHGSDPLAWVPRFERLAPGHVDEPGAMEAADG